MKVRTGFVSNSSSSSFILIGPRIDNKDLFVNYINNNIPMYIFLNYEEETLYTPDYTKEELLTYVDKLLLEGDVIEKKFIKFEESEIPVNEIPFGENYLLINGNMSYYSPKTIKELFDE